MSKDTYPRREYASGDGRKMGHRYSASCSCSKCWGKLPSSQNPFNRGGSPGVGGGREARQGQATYGRGSRSGGYGRSSYSMRAGTFDGLPSLSRKRGDGAIEIFYQAGAVDMNNPTHGHAVIKDGKVVCKRRPGESTPVVDND